MDFIFIRKLVAAFRSLRFVLHLIYGALLAIPFPVFSQESQQKILRKWSAELLEIFNVQVIPVNAESLSIQGGLVVANHISWLDVFVINSILPTRFVAKSDVRNWPFFGWLCSRAQTLFIERGKARAAARINLELVECLVSGERFSVFPEGTTTNGRAVGHFHSSLLQPAIDAGVVIQPFALRYQNRQGERSEDAAYIDDISFGQSLWSILCSRNLHVQLIATPVLDATEMDRRTLAKVAQQYIEKALEIEPTFIGEDEEHIFIDSSYSLNPCATSNS